MLSQKAEFFYRRRCIGLNWFSACAYKFYLAPTLEGAVWTSAEQLFAEKGKKSSPRQAVFLAYQKVHITIATIRGHNAPHISKININEEKITFLSRWQIIG